ncbi:MAG: peptidylprolyl isomerase [Acidobacteriota bacterium]
MWSTRSLRRLAAGAAFLMLPVAGMAGPLAPEDDAGKAETAGSAEEAGSPRIVLEIRGLHYDAGDPVQVRISAHNEGDDTVDNPLADPLAAGFRLTGPDGKTMRPKHVGSAHPDRRPRRLEPEAYFGTVLDLDPFFPALADIGQYELTYDGKDAHSNQVKLNIIQAFDEDASYQAVIHTTQGDLTLDLYNDVAPITVRNFVDLSRQGFYDGLTFHYVRAGDLLIGGDPNGDGSGGSGFRIPAEFNNRKHLTGTVGMVRTADPNSASSQFYICLAPRPERDGHFTVFGQITDGFDVLEKLAAVPTTEKNEPPYYRPLEPLTIDQVAITETETKTETTAAAGDGGR